jgi:hypothetical protein
MACRPGLSEDAERNVPRSLPAPVVWPVRSDRFNRGYLPYQLIDQSLGHRLHGGDGFKRLAGALQRVGHGFGA